MASFLTGLIGSGIGPSLSPALHEAEAAHHGLRCVYRLVEVGDDDVGDLLAMAVRLGFDGLNVTHPCKQSVIPHLDELSPDAAELGAVNTVVFRDGRAIGHNTDWRGFAQSFARGLPGASLDRVVLLGAGGAGTAVAHALLTMGAGHILVVDEDEDRARTLARRLGERAEAGPLVLKDADGLVHATPTGMAHHPGLPLPAELLHPGLWVADIVYRPLETELLERARALGCRVLDGGGMVVFQAAYAFRLFTGCEPDTERMLSHLKDLICEEPSPPSR